MKDKIFFFVIIITFFTIFILFYQGLRNSSIYIPKIDVEKKIPSLKVKLFNTNNEISSEEIFKKDKFYIMNIWASWCVPCRYEHSYLIDLFNQKNIEIIGLNYKDNNKNAKKFLKELGNPYKIILLDNDGTIAIEWGAYGVPETFLIYDQKIIKKIIGPLNDDYVVEIKNLIK